MRETAGLVTNNLYHHHPEGEEQYLAQWVEEFSKILREKAGLLHGGEVATSGHDGPARDVVAAFRQLTRRHGNLFGEYGHRHRRPNTVGR